MTRPDVSGSVQAGLSSRHISVLAHLCMLPFVEADEMAVISGATRSTTHRTLTELMTSGLARRVPHSFDRSRRAYRWIPTAVGAAAFSDPGAMSEQELSGAIKEAGDWVPIKLLASPGGILRVGHATAHWQRVMSHRLDILTCVYRLLGTICEVEESRPAEFRLYRGLSHDAAVRMPGGACYGMIVRRPAFGGAYFRRRFGAAREAALGLTATFIVAPGGEELRTIATEARSLDHVATAVGPAGGIRDQDEPLWIEPDNPGGRFSLRRAVTSWRREGLLPYERPAKRRRLPDESLKMPPHLSRAEADILRAVADWPLSEPRTIGAITSRNGPWLRKQLTNVRRSELVRSVRVGGVSRLSLADPGIRLVSLSSRTNAQENRKRWSSQRGRNRSFVGGMMTQLAREIGHNDMAHDFLSSVYRDSSRIAEFEILDAVPPHRGMKFFQVGGRTLSIRPDATIIARTCGERHVLLMEFERRAVFPKAMQERLEPYLRYFKTGRWPMDFGVVPKVMVVLENRRIESRFLENQEVASVSHFPVFTSNEKDLARLGPLGRAWCRLGSHDGGRVEFSSY